MTVFAVVGPTASGKTALGIALAQAIGAQIVNADAMQCYQGMDIGTAKPSPDEQTEVPHHCLDLWAPNTDATVAMWRAEAAKAVEGLDHAVIVGGSGLYVRALLDDWDLPGTDARLRAQLEAELANNGPLALHTKLASVDPQAAADILPGNGRRIVRALEVIALTGKPFNARLPTPGPTRWDARIIYLDPDLETVDQRIEHRARSMFARGLVTEAMGLRFSRSALRAIGYAQALAVGAGELSESEAVAQTALATRRFVRRQRAWWRTDPRVRYVTPVYRDGELDRVATVTKTLEPPP